LKVAIMSFILAVFMFLVGVLIGSSLQRSYIADAEKTLYYIQSQFEDLESAMYLPYSNKDLTCKYLAIKLQDVDKSLERLQPSIVKMERDLNVNSEMYRMLKTRFISTRLKYWLLSEQLRSSCNPNTTTALFFYTTKDKCDDCTTQGYILSHVQSKVGKENFYVSAVDVNEDLVLIKTITLAYNISDVPAVIIDGSTVKKGLVNESVLIDYICSKITCNSTE